MNTETKTETLADVLRGLYGIFPSAPYWADFIEKNPDHHLSAEIQWACQQGCETRGWKIKMETKAGWAFAEIWRPIDIGWEWVGNAVADSPDLAIATALRNALTAIHE